jgi:hypothetical protein
MYASRMSHNNSAAAASPPCSIYHTPLPTAAAAAEALDYLVARVQEDYNVEAGAQQQQRRAVSMLVKPLGAPGEAAKNKAVEADS